MRNRTAGLFLAACSYKESCQVFCFVPADGESIIGDILTIKTKLLKGGGQIDIESVCPRC